MNVRWKTRYIWWHGGCADDTLRLTPQVDSHLARVHCKGRKMIGKRKTFQKCHLLPLTAMTPESKDLKFKENYSVPDLNKRFLLD